MLISETIAFAVRHHRERLDLSQAELARRMKAQGLPWYPATVARTESADRPLRLDEAVTLAGVLEVRVQDLYALPEVSDPEIEALKQELEATYETYHETRMAQLRAEAELSVYRHAVERTRIAFQEAQNEYESALSALNDADLNMQKAAEMAANIRARLDELRARVERMQRRKQQAALLRNLQPGDEVSVTIENVEPAKTRFTKRADGVIFELVNEDGEVVLRSDPFENEQIAKEQAAFFIDRYAGSRRKKKASKG